MLLLLQSPNNDACIAVGSEVLRLLREEEAAQKQRRAGWTVSEAWDGIHSILTLVMGQKCQTQ
jgi:hypothetical protein